MKVRAHAELEHAKFLENVTGLPVTSHVRLADRTLFELSALKLFREEGGALVYKPVIIRSTFDPREGK